MLSEEQSQWLSILKKQRFARKSSAQRLNHTGESLASSELMGVSRGESSTMGMGTDIKSEYLTHKMQKAMHLRHKSEIATDSLLSMNHFKAEPLSSLGSMIRDTEYKKVDFFKQLRGGGPSSSPPKKSLNTSVASGKAKTRIAKHFSLFID